ncbi:MAG: helix-turn-helix transcriptional regulator [Bacteroidia bacterium]|nr:helix-turn-helix transcriptional regulator [Bacteroidia bacterium]
MEDEIKELKELIRNKIIAVRKSKNLKQKEVAQMAGIPYTTYSEAERGIKEFNLDRLLRVCKVLDIDVFAQSSKSTIQYAIDEKTIQDLINDVKEIKSKMGNMDKIEAFFSKLEEVQRQKQIEQDGMAGNGQTF